MADHYESPVMNSIVTQAKREFALDVLALRYKEPLTDDQLARLALADSKQLLRVLQLMYDPQLSLGDVLEQGLTRPTESEADDSPHPPEAMADRPSPSQ